MHHVNAIRHGVQSAMPQSKHSAIMNALKTILSMQSEESAIMQKTGDDVMPENTCICCGKVIPEGRQVCLSCGDYDDMQTFKNQKEEKLKSDIREYFELLRQKDDEDIL